MASYPPFILVCVIVAVNGAGYDRDMFSNRKSEVVSMDEINSKVDKVYHLTSQFHDQFKWEKSILTEMAMTQSHVLREIRDQEKRIRRLNRNLKRTLKFCAANQELLSAREVTTTSPYKVFHSNEIENTP